MQSSKVPHIDICIATYKRPKILAQLLLSIANLVRSDAFNYAVILVDNDADESACDIASEFVHTGMPLRYLLEPRKNISLARNMAIEASQADFIAIVDDDEQVPPDWLKRLFEAQASHCADAVFGPVRAYFPPHVRNFLTENGFFARPDPETGAVKKFVPATSNVLVRRKALERLGYLFDPAFGVTGGEDTDLFYRLRQTGATWVWCREAYVEEYFGEHRTTLTWLFLRHLSCGMIWSRVHKPSSFSQWPVFVGMRLLGPLISFKKLVPSATNDRVPKIARFSLRLVGSIGELIGLFSIKYRAYDDRRYLPREG